MQEIKTSSLTYELSPREAEAFAGVVERLPELKDPAKEGIRSFRELAKMIDEGAWHEFSLIIKVRLPSC
jgi:hypothetical protein